MAKRSITLNMDEELIDKIGAIAKQNHRKRGPEINVAVEFYLKYQDTDLDASSNHKEEPKQDVCDIVKEEKTILKTGMFSTK